VQVIKTHKSSQNASRKLPKESNQKLSYKKPQAQLAEVVVVRESEKKSKEKIEKNQHKNGRRKTTMK
jgi:hypothetical protein